MTDALFRFQSSCVVCGTTEKESLEKYGCSLTIDHVRPLSKGHGLKPGNAAVLCKGCNSSKKERLLNQLPFEDAFKILHAAEHFRCYWGVLHETL